MQRAGRAVSIRRVSALRVVPVAPRLLTPTAAARGIFGRPLSAMATTDDHRLMGLALDEARAALAEREMPIGCAFVDPATGTVLTTGRNRTNVDYNPTAHAEVVAIEAFLARGGDLARLRGSDLYVTIEPCIMCASVLSRVGIRRAVYGPGNDKFGGCGSICSIHAGMHAGAHHLPVPGVAPGVASTGGNSGGGAGTGGGGAALMPAGVDDAATAAAVIASALAHARSQGLAVGDDAGTVAGAPESGASSSAAAVPLCCCGSATCDASTPAACCAYRPFDVVRGVRSDEAVALLQSFYSRGNVRAPTPRVRTTASSSAAGESALDNGDDANAHTRPRLHRVGCWLS